MQKIIILLASCMSCIYLDAQELISIKNAGDCSAAIEISTLSKFGPTGAPKEIKLETSGSPFGKTLYQVWYKFSTEKEGLLLFDVIPIDPDDNYDFLLYKAESSSSCAEIKAGKLTEIRSNISRNEQELNGLTGLSISGKSDSYSDGIEVKKGEYYFLVLNSMYKCKGHTIVFKYLENFSVYGKVMSYDNNQPLQAQVFWTNLRTKETSSFISTNKEGEFVLPVLINTEAHKFPNYLLWAFTENYYVADTVIASKDIPNLEKMPFNFKLHKLKKGLNDFLPGILFEPNDEQIISASIKDLERVLKLMQQNQHMEIILEGHSNGFYPSTEVDNVLSLKRAETVKKWLTDNGIAPERIDTKGFGSEKMMFPMAQDENEEQMNRRVEINISKL